MIKKILKTKNLSHTRKILNKEKQEDVKEKPKKTKKRKIFI